MEGKEPTNLDVLRSISPEDMRVILQGYLGSGSAQADAKTYIKVYQLYVLENKSIIEIAKLFRVTRDTIDQKIKRMALLVKRKPILIDKLPPDTDVFSIPVDRLIMSDRTYHCLEKAGVKTIGDLIELSESELLRTRNLGRKTLYEIKSILWKLMSRFRSLPRLSEDIERLKACSEAASSGTEQWSRGNHERLVQVLGAMEKKVTETRGLIDLILKSAYSVQARASLFRGIYCSVRSMESAVGLAGFRASSGEGGF